MDSEKPWHDRWEDDLALLAPSNDIYEPELDLDLGSIATTDAQRSTSDIDGFCISPQMVSSHQVELQAPSQALKTASTYPICHDKGQPSGKAARCSIGGTPRVSDSDYEYIDRSDFSNSKIMSQQNEAWWANSSQTQLPLGHTIMGYKQPKRSHRSSSNDRLEADQLGLQDQTSDPINMLRAFPDLRQTSEEETSWQWRTSADAEDIFSGGRSGGCTDQNSTVSDYMFPPLAPDMLQDTYSNMNPTTPRPQQEHDYDLDTFDPGDWTLPSIETTMSQPFSPDTYPQHSPSTEPDSSFRKGKRKRPSETPSLADNPSCLDCGKRFRATNRLDRCTRCASKHERATASPPIYTLDASVPSVETARQLVYPLASPTRNVPANDNMPSAQVLQHRTDAYVDRLLDAVNSVAGDEPWAARQQHVFNGKAKMEDTYANAHVTARVRALFHELILFHSTPRQTQQRTFYAVGGDNAGYPIDRRQTFSVRFENICAVLRVNKRVVMDVVEGRGVQGFVGNPWVYHRRKASNNDCNVKKKVIMEKGRELEGELGDDDAEAGPSRSRIRVRKGRSGREMSTESDDDYDGEAA